MASKLLIFSIATGRTFFPASFCCFCGTRVLYLPKYDYFSAFWSVTLVCSANLGLEQDMCGRFRNVALFKKCCGFRQNCGKSRQCRNPKFGSPISSVVVGFVDSRVPCRLQVGAVPQAGESGGLDFPFQSYRRLLTLLFLSSITRSKRDPIK